MSVLDGARCERGQVVRPMPSYDELVELARMCWREAHRSRDDVARELRRMASHYQQQAAMLDGGKLPDIGNADDRTEPIV